MSATERPRIALDTNILIYAERLAMAPNDGAKVALAQRLLLAMADQGIVLSRQALAELQRVLVRKARLTPIQAADRVRLWAARCDLVETDGAVFDAALTLSNDHGLQIFDAIIMAAAVQARCDMLLSEDLQDGFAWRGVVVCNPFGPSPDKRLTTMLSTNP